MEAEHATHANASANKMEEEEIENWYEEEKQKGMDDYLKEIEEKKDHDISQKKYEDRLQKTIAKYNKLMEDKIRKKRAGKSMISKIKDKFPFFGGR